MPMGIYKRTEEHKIKLREKSGRKPMPIIIGSKMGRLTILKELPRYISLKGRKVRVVECKCECGSIKSYFLNNIKQEVKSLGNMSCGCWQKEIVGNYSRNRDYPKGKDSHAWKGGLTDRNYPDDWTHTLRTSIRERDNYSCRMCGIHHGDVSLSIHHIDYDKFNCNPNNLISLCRQCHQKTNFKREYWKEFLKNYLIVN